MLCLSLCSKICSFCFLLNSFQIYLSAMPWLWFVCVSWWLGLLCGDTEMIESLRSETWQKAIRLLWRHPREWIDVPPRTGEVTIKGPSLAPCLSCVSVYHVSSAVLAHSSEKATHHEAFTRAEQIRTPCSWNSGTICYINLVSLGKFSLRCSVITNERRH